jgi:hypothetical protein
VVQEKEQNMQCSKCGRKHSGTKKICIYCGALIIGKAPPQPDDHVSKGGNISISTKKKKSVKLHDLAEHICLGKTYVIETDEHEILQPRLETANGSVKLLDLPDHIRQQVEEAIRQDKDDAIVEEHTIELPLLLKTGQEYVKIDDLPEHIRKRLEEAVHQGKDAVISIEDLESVFPRLETAAEQCGDVTFEQTLTALSGLRDSFNSGRLEYSVYEKMVSNVIKDYISTLDNQIQIQFVFNKIMDSELSDYLNEKLLKDLRNFVLSSISDKKKPDSVTFETFLVEEDE